MNGIVRCPQCTSDRGIMVSDDDHHYYFSFTGSPMGRYPRYDKAAMPIGPVQCATCFCSLALSMLDTTELVPAVKGVIGDEKEKLT